MIFLGYMENMATKNIVAIEAIKKCLANGFITYEEASILAEPIIERMNEKAKEIAKKHRKTFIPFQFSKLIR